MSLYGFFRLLNYKIKQYEKTASNPFDRRFKNYPVTLIWIEDSNILNDKKEL